MRCLAPSSAIRCLVGLAVVVTALLSPAAAQAATGFVRVGSFVEGFADGGLRHQGKLGVVRSSGLVLRVDVVGDQVLVYAPTEFGADVVAAFGAGVLSDPFGVAVDQVSGAVYVADAGNGRVVRFVSDGQPVPGYTLDGSFTSPVEGGGVGEVASFAAAIAVDPVSGDLLVADPGDDLVKRFDDEGAFVGSFDGADSAGGVFTGLQDLAVDSAGDVLVVDSDGGDPADGAAGRVERFDGLGVWEGSLGPVENAANVAVRPATDEVVVSGNQDAVNDGQPPAPSLFVFDGSSSVELSVDGSAYYSTVSGLAVDGGPGGRLYVGTDTSRGAYPAGYGLVSVQVYEPVMPEAPTIDLDASASGVTTSSAVLAATVDPNLAETSYYFEYGTTDSYGTQTTPGSAGAGDDPVEVSDQLSGLAPATTYHFRIVVDNGIGGPVQGADQTFTTAPALAPVVQPPLASATDVGRTSATLNASVNPRLTETSYYFEYGATAGYGTQTTPGSAGGGGVPVAVVESLSGLEPNTVYHFRVVADNGHDGPVTGSDRTFTTRALAPTATTGQPTGVGTSGATLHGTVDSHGVTASYSFHVVQTNGVRAITTPATTIPPSTGPVAITAQIDDLPAGAKFEVRLGATSTGGATTGGMQTFTTQPKPHYTPNPPAVDDPDPYNCQTLHNCPTQTTPKPNTPSNRPSNRFTLSRVTANATTATLRVTLPGKGRVTAQGPGIPKTTKTTTAKRTITLRLKLNKATRKKLANSPHGRLTRRIQIAYRPTGGTTRTTSRTVTFKKATRR